MNYELIGLPGTGKSFYSKNKKVIKINSRTEKLLFVFLFIIDHPLLFLRLTDIIYKESDYKILKHKFLFLFLNAIAIQEKSCFLNNYFIDEGIIQFIVFGLYEKELNNEDKNKILRLLKYFTKNKKIIILKSQAAEKRMVKRKRIPRVFMGEQYVTNWLKVIKKNFSYLEKNLKDSFLVQEIMN